MKDYVDMDFIIRMKVAEVLTECRKEKGMTQAELAKAIGSSPTTVATWEQGKSMPSVQMLYRLSKYYEKTMDYMYGETKSPLPRGNEEEDQQKRS